MENPNSALGKPCGGECAKPIYGLSYICQKCGLHCKIRKRRYLSGKRVYKTEQMEPTIPAKFKNIIEPFLNKDLKVEAKVKDNQLTIEAKPAETRSQR